MINKEVICNSLYGAIVGDALGVPFENKSRNSYKWHPSDGYVGYKTHNQLPGTWSDDSSLILATMAAIAKNNGEIVLTDIMDNFLRWRKGEAFTPHGMVFDVGGTTSRTIDRYEAGVDVYHCGEIDELSCGNGSLMRILPLAFCGASDEEIKAVSALTHGHETVLKCCRDYVNQVRIYANGNALLYRDIKDRERWQVKSDGYVVNSYEAALWCFYNSYSFEECMWKAVNLGGDTDTIACIAGGLAGTVFEVDEKWKKGLSRWEWIEEEIEKFIKIVF